MVGRLADYPGAFEVVPGVWIDYDGGAVYICDASGEIATWNYDEICADNSGWTAALTAVILATALGPSAVRQNRQEKGAVLEALIDHVHAGRDVTHFKAWYALE